MLHFDYSTFNVIAVDYLHKCTDPLFFFVENVVDVIDGQRTLPMEDLVVLVGHVLDQLDAARGVTELVIVPRNKLDKGVRKGNTGLGVKDGRVSITNKIGRDNIVLGVAHDSLHLALGGLLDDSLDLLIGGRLGKAGSQVNNRDVGGRDTEGHTSQLAVQVGDDLADSLGSTSRRGDDVGAGPTASAPILARRTVDGLLGGGGGVDGGHEGLSDAKVVVDNLGKGGQAVGGARGVGDDLVLGLVGVQVDSADKHGGVGRGGRDDDLLGTALQVEGGLLDGGEDSGGLDDVLGALLTPRNLIGATLVKDSNLVAIDNEVTILGLDMTLVATVGGVVLEHVNHVGEVNEWIVDSDDLDVLVSKSCAEDETTNASETGDTERDSHNE